MFIPDSSPIMFPSEIEKAAKPSEGVETVEEATNPDEADPEQPDPEQAGMERDGLIEDRKKIQEEIDHQQGVMTSSTDFEARKQAKEFFAAAVARLKVVDARIAEIDALGDATTKA